MNLVSINATQTMSTREIANLLQNDHSNLKISAERLAKNGVISTLAPQEFTHKGNVYIQYMLNKRDSLILVAQNCPEFTAAIVDRWQELEAQQATKLPQTKLEWMQLAVEQEQALIAQQSVIDDQVEKLAIAAPAVQFVERYVETKSSKSLSDVAKVIGWKPQAFIKQLADDKVLFKRGGAWLPFQTYLDREYFTVTTGESNGHAFNQTRVTSSGVAWLAKEYGR